MTYLTTYDDIKSDDYRFSSSEEYVLTFGFANMRATDMSAYATYASTYFTWVSSLAGEAFMPLFLPVGHTINTISTYTKGRSSGVMTMSLKYSDYSVSSVTTVASDDLAISTSPGEISLTSIGHVVVADASYCVEYLANAAASDTYIYGVQVTMQGSNMGADDFLGGAL